ncbi:MAG: outer membrane beta-barrel protein [Bacteroidetes bacterium]|nr:outer membrane beta-barrel protein [Bacteroidota bacterium]
MKKLLFLVLLMPVLAFAQKPGKTKGGTKTSTFKGGLTSSTLLFQSQANEPVQMKFKSDFSLGYQFDFYAGRVMSFSFGLGLQNAGAVTHYFTQRVNYDLTYISANTGPSFHIPIGRSSDIQFGGTVYGQYLAAATQEGGNLYIDLLREGYLENYDVGFGLNAGLRLQAGFSSAIVLQAEYMQGLLDIEKHASQQLYNTLFNFHFGYQFIF